MGTPTREGERSWSTSRIQGNGRRPPHPQNLLLLRSSRGREANPRPRQGDTPEVEPTQGQRSQVTTGGATQTKGRSTATGSRPEVTVDQYLRTLCRCRRWQHFGTCDCDTRLEAVLADRHDGYVSSGGPALCEGGTARKTTPWRRQHSPRSRRSPIRMLSRSSARLVSGSGRATRWSRSTGGSLRAAGSSIARRLSRHPTGGGQPRIAAQTR